MPRRKVRRVLATKASERERPRIGPGTGPMPSKLVCLGVIGAPHGVRGAVRIKSHTDDPAAVASYGPLMDETGERRYRIKVTGAARGALIAEIEGVATRDAAEALRGRRLYLPRETLPEPEADEFYYADLIGLRAELADGTTVGKVCAVRDFGAGDLIEIDRGDGDTVMLRFTKESVPVVDIDGKRLVIEPDESLE